MLLSRLLRLILHPLVVLGLLLSVPSAAQTENGAWSLDEYGRLAADLEFVDEERALSPADTDVWRETTIRSLVLRREMISLISRSIRDGSIPPEFVEPAAAERLLLIQNVVILLTELGDCAQAESASGLLDSADVSSSAEVQAAREAAQRSIQSCSPSGGDLNAAGDADSDSSGQVDENACPAGQMISVDTRGFCCWEGQAHNGSQCVGRPINCPHGYTIAATGCDLPDCADGQERASDGVHCCWPGQAYSSAQQQCLGDAICGEGYVWQGDACISEAALIAAQLAAEAQAAEERERLRQQRISEVMVERRECVGRRNRAIGWLVPVTAMLGYGAYALTRMNVTVDPGTPFERQYLQPIHLAIGAPLALTGAIATPISLTRSARVCPTVRDIP